MEKRIPWNDIIKDFKGELTDVERSPLNRWLADDRNADVYRELRRVWLSVIAEGADYSSNADVLWSRMALRMRVKKEPEISFTAKTFRIVASVAAVLLVALLSFTGYMGIEWYRAGNIHQTYASLGGKSKIALPDGSQVWLNADSKLEYSTNFWSKIRKVKLEGEAYFDVKKDPDRMFVVNMQGVALKVHGTSFNVEAPKGGARVEVSLLSGSVTMEKETLSQQIKPGEKAVYSKKEDAIRVETADVAFAALWANESIHFERKSIRQLAKYLSKWYGVEIIVDPSLTEDQAYTFSIRHEPLEEILRLMARINPISYTFSEKNIVRITEKTI